MSRMGDSADNMIKNEIYHHETQDGMIIKNQIFEPTDLDLDLKIDAEQDLEELQNSLKEANLLNLDDILTREVMNTK